MENETFEIKTSVFEGPLDLLLQLIEKRKLLISDVALSTVTDDYIKHVKTIEHFSISKTSHFIYIASTLLLLKSKALLPNLSLTDEEEASIEDLEHRLKLYKYFQNLTKKIGEIYGKNVIYMKIPTKITSPIFSPQKNFTAEVANLHIKDVINKLPKKTKKKEVAVKKIISLEKSIEDLGKRIQSSLKVSFSEFSKLGKTEKVNVIVSFLAMLELVKQEIISVTQRSHFEDIEMESKDVGLPRY